MKIIPLFLLLLTCQLSFSQIPKDIDNKEILETQRTGSYKIMATLKAGEIVKAMEYFDTTLPDIKKKLTEISGEIKKVESGARLSVVIVFEHNRNVNRCRYYKGDETYYQLDLHYEEGNANSLMLELATKDAETLKKEQEKRMESDDIPPPPPPIKP